MSLRFETRTAVITIEDGVVINVIKAGATETDEDARENVLTIARIADRLPVPVLVDLGQAYQVTFAARRLYASAETAKTIGVAALLVSSPVSRVIGKFFLGLNKPGMPVQIFSDSDEALRWLRSHLDD